MIRKINFFIICALLLSGLIMTGGCDKDEHQHFDDYDPEIDDDELPVKEKPKYLWLDASANFKRFSNRDSIAYYLEKAKQTGFTAIVVDVRPVVGDVMYPSSIAQELTSWKGYTSDASWDYLQAFIDQGQGLDLKVFASMNIFTGGHNDYNQGVVYRDQQMGALTSILNRPEGLVDITEVSDKYGAFFNPANSQVQRYCLSLIEEVVRNYQIDGLILDRVRYDGLNSDFSQNSREQFEQYIGQNVENYPDDIFYWIQEDGEYVREMGDLYPQWLEWRAKVIYDFFMDAREAVHEIDPDMQFGTYTGAWYPTYYKVGANWASKNYDPRNDNYTNWMYTSKYKNYGYAGLLDVYMTGVYYPTLYGTGWYTVEGGLNHAQRIVKKDVPVISGLYAQVYSNSPKDMEEAVELSLTGSAGLMVFDIIQVVQYGFWDDIEAGIQDVINQEEQK